MNSNQYGPPWARLLADEACAIALLAMDRACEALHDSGGVLSTDRDGQAWLTGMGQARLEQLELGRWRVATILDPVTRQFTCEVELVGGEGGGS